MVAMVHVPGFALSILISEYLLINCHNNLVKQVLLFLSPSYRWLNSCSLKLGSMFVKWKGWISMAPLSFEGKNDLARECSGIVLTPVVFKLSYISESPGGLVKEQIARPHCQSFWFSGFGQCLRICISFSFLGDADSGLSPVMGGCDVSQDRGEPTPEISSYGITSHINMSATRSMRNMYMTLYLLIYYLSEFYLLHWNE